MSYAVARNITADASFIAITPFLCTFVMCFSLPLEGDVIIVILIADAKGVRTADCDVHEKKQMFHYL